MGDGGNGGEVNVRCEEGDCGVVVSVCTVDLFVYAEDEQVAAVETRNTMSAFCRLSKIL